MCMRTFLAGSLSKLSKQAAKPAPPPCNPNRQTQMQGALHDNVMQFLQEGGVHGSGTRSALQTAGSHLSEPMLWVNINHKLLPFCYLLPTRATEPLLHPDRNTSLQPPLGATLLSKNLKIWDGEGGTFTGQTQYRWDRERYALTSA